MIKILQILNVVLIVINGLVFFLPKRPVTGMHGNAAGTLSFIVFALIALLLLHVVLYVVAIGYGKNTMLRIISLVMVPVSLLFWYYIVPTIRF